MGMQKFCLLHGAGRDVNAECTQPIYAGKTGIKVDLCIHQLAGLDAFCFGLGTCLITNTEYRKCKNACISDVALLRKLWPLFPFQTFLDVAVDQC